MATYKVLQDIEAEDKLIGPLTLKQFIFAIIASGIGFIEFKLITAPQLTFIRWPFVIVLLLPMAVFGFLAAPIGRDQPNDVWLLARLRFLIKPHIRIWNQDGTSELVRITVPKKTEHALTNGLRQEEVQSRLTALASTLDSRGWAIKNVDVNLFSQPGYLNANNTSDRLVAPTSLPSSDPVTDVHASDDMMDESNNPIAQHLDQMVQASTAQHQQAVRQIMQQGSAQTPSTPPADYWFLNQQNTVNSQVVTPGSATTTAPEPTAEEKALIEKIEAENKAAPQQTRLKTIQPLAGQKADLSVLSDRQAGSREQSKPAQLNPVDPYAALNSASPTLSSAPAMQTSTIPVPTASGTTSSPAILNLAHNDDLNVATIARQAKRISEADDEVVISLH